MVLDVPLYQLKQKGEKMANVADEIIQIMGQVPEYLQSWGYLWNYWSSMKRFEIQGDYDIRVVSQLREGGFVLRVEETGFTTGRKDIVCEDLGSVTLRVALG